MFLKSQQLDVSIGMSIATLAVLGFFSGRMAKQNILAHMILMVGLGVTIVLLIRGLGFGP